MKKLLALLLCLVMVVSMAACSGNAPKETTPVTEAPTTQPATTAPAETEPAPVVAEPLPENPLMHYSFDDATGLTSVNQGEKAADSVNDGATFDIVPSNHDILFSNGPVGQCVYLDGKYGIQLDMSNINITDDSYTISFWLNADRLSTYGPVVQMGRYIGHSDATSTVAWLNWTKSTWGANGADIFPVVWNRNSQYNVFPWGYAMDDQEHGKREWILFTLVVDGVGYTCADDALPRIGASFYLDGELKHFANAENMFYQGVSPEILLADGIEGYLGINYWDTIYKGFIDELYIFDEVLTPGQVKTLFEQGDKNVESVKPEYQAPAEETVPTTPAPVLNEIVPAEGAVDTLGGADRTLVWWSDNTDGFELPNNSTLVMKLNNYSDGVNNWDNFVLGFTNTPVKTDLLASPDNYEGYAEYAVLRADAYGWGDASYAYAPTIDWTDWAAWLGLMTDADVTVTLVRADGEVTVEMSFVGADGTTMSSTGVLTSTMTADSPVYVFIGGEGAYIELLSVA